MILTIRVTPRARLAHLPWKTRVEVTPLLLLQPGQRFVIASPAVHTRALVGTTRVACALASSLSRSLSPTRPGWVTPTAPSLDWLACGQRSAAARGSLKLLTDADFVMNTRGELQAAFVDYESGNGMHSAGGCRLIAANVRKERSWDFLSGSQSELWCG